MNRRDFCKLMASFLTAAGLPVFPNRIPGLYAAPSYKGREVLPRKRICDMLDLSQVRSRLEFNPCWEITESILLQADGINITDEDGRLLLFLPSNWLPVSYYIYPLDTFILNFTLDIEE